MFEDWIEVTLADLEPGDFLKASKDAPVFRLDAKDGNTFTMFRPSRSTTRVLKPGQSCLVRILHKGMKTNAGLRFAFLDDTQVNALKEQLGAEMIAVLGENHGRTFQPWIFAEKYTVGELAAHIFMFHGTWIGEPPKTKELKQQLFDMHNEFHKEVLRVDSGRRLPHIHNQTEYERSFQS